MSGHRTVGRTSGVIVAPRKERCSICDQVPAVIAEINTAIWAQAGVDTRRQHYRADAQRVAKANGLEVEVKTITRHADHVAATWHPATEKMPARIGDIAVHPTDYESVVTKAAAIGQQAMEQIARDLPEYEPKVVVAVAKMGVTAVSHRAALDARKETDRTVDRLAAALFGVQSGHMRDVPDMEIIDVTPVEDLLEEVHAERALLEERARGVTT